MLITQREAAVEMRVSMPTYYKIIKNPDFPLISVGRRKMVHKEKLEEWLRKVAEDGRKLY